MKIVELKKKISLSLEGRKSVTGYLFIMPFIVGFFLFFLYPFIQSVIFSLSELEITADGFNLHFIGLENYHYALFIHADFVRIFTETISRMLSDVPLILVFSFFAAVLLNQEFKGRMMARVIFFLPVILGAGIILRLEQADYMTSLLEGGGIEGGGTFLSGAALRNFLMQMRLPEGLLEYITEAVDRIPEIIRASGIQILIFLAGLQSIPPALYEAADVEGATGWESFWMITLPLMSPLILTNIVYTIIDSFTAAHNDLITLIRNTAFGGAGYGVSTAMSWMYFASIAIILAIAISIISKRVYYQE